MPLLVADVFADFAIASCIVFLGGGGDAIEQSFNAHNAKL